MRGQGVCRDLLLAGDGIEVDVDEMTMFDKWERKSLRRGGKRAKTAALRFACAWWFWGADVLSLRCLCSRTYLSSCKRGYTINKDKRKDISLGEIYKQLCFLVLFHFFYAKRQMVGSTCLEKRNEESNKNREKSKKKQRKFPYLPWASLIAHDQTMRRKLGRPSVRK